MNQRAIKFRAWREGKYEIGSDGSIWSTDFNHTGKRKELRQYPDYDGYRVIYFNINGKRTIHAIHRLVANAFLAKPTPKHQVNHKNGDCADNRLENLEWLTSRENTIHGWQRGRIVSREQRLVMSKTAIKVNQRRWHPEQYAKAA